MKQLIGFLLLIAALGTFGADWKNTSPAASRLEMLPDGLAVVATGVGRFDGGVAHVWKDAPRNAEKLEFSADVKADRNALAYIQVKLYRDGKELSRLDSPLNAVRPGRYRILFTPGDADRIELLCRTRLTEANIGRRAEFTDLYFGAPRPEKVQQRPRLETVPGYQVCSVILNNCRTAPETELFIRRGDGREERARFSLTPIPGENCARGSLLGLTENTRYRLRLVVREGDRREELATEFTTLSPRVPVAKTIELSQGDRLAVTESGTPDGYIRYTAKPGFVLDATDRFPEAVLLDNVENIILDGLTVRGGKVHAIQVSGCRNIQILNCDIAGFGRIGKQNTGIDGKFFENGRALNNDSGIRVQGCENILIERNYIHDPRGTSNSWFYSHPAGPNAVFIGDTAGAAIRFNDFPGSDGKRWNDVIEGWNNGSPNGSVYRDAEITGNYLAFANDDGMELDGGQQNCRFFGNKVEGTLCGVSTAPCLGGPSYIWNNRFTDFGEENGLTGVGIKNNYGSLGSGKVFLFDNTVVGDVAAVSDFGGKPEQYAAAGNPDKLWMRNNLLAVSGSLLAPGLFRPTIRIDLDGDLLCTSNPRTRALADFRKLGQEPNGTARKPDFAAADAADYTITQSGHGAQGDVPTRPTPFRVGRARIALDMTDPSQAESAQVTVTVTQPGFAGDFRIVRNDASRFFSVTPSAGKLEAGKPLVLTVTVEPGQITAARINRGAFLIRLADGLSRPVSVQVDSTRCLPLVRRDRQNVVVGKVSVLPEDGGTALDFDVPRSGEYYLFARWTGSAPPRLSLTAPDGAVADKISLTPRTRPDAWNALAGNTYGGTASQPFRLSAGKHRFIARQVRDFRFQIREIALAPAPAALLSPLPVPAADGPRILLAGDSTVADYPANRAPMNGWGQQLNAFLPSGVEVRNHAVGGRSTKSFRAEGRWDRLREEIRKGDTVLIQFGHNDQKKDRPEIYAAAESDYRDNLTRFIAEVRERGGEPVIVTPIQRRTFGKDGAFLPSLGGYPDAARAVASANRCRLIDLNRFTEELFRRDGVERSKRYFTFAAPGEYPSYPQGSADNSHLNTAGAAVVAREVARQLLGSLEAKK